MVSMLKRAHGKAGVQGFTLIELLVVIAIIGILSSVVLASLNTARLKARDARRLSDIGQLQLALAVYYDSNSNTYPLLLSSLTPTYIARIPADSLAGEAYSYSPLGSSATCSSYHLGMSFEDITNSALRSDVDATAGTACTGGAADFSGLTTVAGGSPCSGTAGTAQTNGTQTETCYDVSPL